MRISKNLFILGLILLWLSQAIGEFKFVEEVEIELDDKSATGLNDICGITTTSDSADFWAVGDEGRVILLKAGMKRIREKRDFRLLNREYDFHGVSFATPDTGWIVGYKRNEPDKWKGVILKTTNGGNNWSEQYPTVVPDLNIPFLDVCAVDEDNVWISCGNGEVLKTRDGGQRWIRCNKPGGQSHYGWLWGIWANSADTAWVCSDQTELIAKTEDGGAIWTVFTPYDNLSYYDVAPYEPEYSLPSSRKVCFAASTGKIIYTTNDGQPQSWGSLIPLNNPYELIQIHL